MTSISSKTEPLSTKANTLWNAMGCLFYLGCQWVTTLLVVVLSSNYDNSGVLAFAMSIGNMFAAVALYKIRTYQVSDTLNTYSANAYVGFRLVSVGISAMLATFYLLLITKSMSMIVASLLYILFKADESFNDVFYGIEQKKRRMDYIGKSQVLRGFASLAGFAIPLAVTGNLYAAIIGMTACCMCVTVFYDRRNAMLFGFTKPGITRDQAKKLGRACLMPTIANLLATSIVSVVRQRYGIAYGEELLGIYASVATPAVLVQAAASYLYSPLIGLLAERKANGGTAPFRKLFGKILLMLIACIAILVAACSIPGQLFLTAIYGSSIANHVWLLPYALIATGSVALQYYINDVLIILRNGTGQLIINIAALALASMLIGPLAAAFAMNGINLAIIGSCLAASLVGIGLVIYTSSN